MNELALCSGGDGFGLGLSLVFREHRVVCHVEREAWAAANLVKKMEAGTLAQAPVWSELRTFDARPWRGKVHIVTAGIPCQPFSLAGKRKGTEDERFLWPQAWHIVRRVEPTFLFLEEVPQFVHDALPAVLGELAEGGWDAEWDLFSAAVVGAPQRRRRLFLLAYNNGYRLHPEGLHARRREEGQGASESCGEGEDLAHPERARRGAEHAPGGCDEKGHDRQRQETSRSAQLCGVLADSGSAGRAASAGLLRAGQPAPADKSEELGAPRHSPRCPTKQRQREMSPSISRQPSEGLADAERRTLRQQPGRRGRPDREEAAVPGQPRTVFPPGPDNLSAWQAILKADPTLEPAVCRASHGLAHRVDRLRLCGNGVVPLVAAVAFLVLAERLGLEE